MQNSIFEQNRKLKATAYLVLGLYAILVAYPLLFLLFTSLKDNQEFFTNLFGLPHKYEFINYVNAWNVGKLGTYFWNSFLVTSVSVVLTCVVSMLGGYALSKLYIPRAQLILDAFMTFNFIPGIAIYIALYSMLGRMNMTGNHWMMILPYAAWQIPFSLYIMKQYFDTVPSALIESARIDGCNEMHTFLHIMLPMVMPAVATIVVFTFINNWGEMMWASIATNSNVSIRTLPVGLLNFKTEMGVQWGQYTAGICLVTLPLMVVFAYFQKYFVAGLTKGAVKG